MKEIPNVLYTAAIPASESPTGKEVPPETTASLLILALNIPPPGEGFTPASIRARNRVEEAIGKVKVGGIIKLEDADFKTAVECVKLIRWGKRDKYVLKFVELFGL